jgi:hypothetical protein
MEAFLKVSSKFGGKKWFSSLMGSLCGSTTVTRGIIPNEGAVLWEEVNNDQNFQMTVYGGALNLESVALKFIGGAIFMAGTVYNLYKYVCL